MKQIHPAVSCYIYKSYNTPRESAGFVPYINFGSPAPFGGTKERMLPKLYYGISFVSMHTTRPPLLQDFVAEKPDALYCIHAPIVPSHASGTTLLFPNNAPIDVEVI